MSPLMPPPAAGAPPGAPPPDASAAPPPQSAPGAGPPPPGAGGPPPAGEPPPPKFEGPAADEGTLDDEAVTEFVDKAFQIIYGGDTADGELSSPVAGMLRAQANDPEEALAQTAAEIAGRVATSAAESNVSLDPAAVLAGTMELVGELASVASAEGISDFSQDEVNGAASKAMEKLYALTKGTGLFPQEQAVAEATDIVRASKTPEMDQSIREIQGASPGGMQ